MSISINPHSDSATGQARDTGEPSPGTALRQFTASCVIVLLIGIGCGGPELARPHHFDFTAGWAPVDSLNRALPSGVRVFSYSQEHPALRAWFVRVDTGSVASPDIVIARDATTGRGSVGAISEENDACIAVNGGYFDMAAEPTRHVGLLWLADTLHTAATRLAGNVGANHRYRAAIGLSSGGHAAVGWAGDSSGVLVRVDAGQAVPWPMSSALGAGPMLLRNGEYAVTATEESFARTSIPATHPRTAVGVTTNGGLILMVVDGRQDASRGVNLAELSDLMRSAGAIDAMNLDGGGSSTLVVRGHLINRPTGGTFQRPVMSAIIARCE